MTIIARSPFRISLGGGGSDLSSYYSRFGGFLIAAGIDKYCTILISKRFYNDIRLAYSKMEIKNTVDEIEHPLFRESIRFVGLDDSVEIHSNAEVPAGSGLGSSSCFTVTLLNALHTYKKENISRKQLAEEAAHIEIDVLKSPIGKQDHYACVFGGLNCYTFEKDGNVIVEPLKASDDTISQLESNLQYYYTGVERDTNEILKEQDDKSKALDDNMLNNLHEVKQIGLDTKKALESGNVDELGELLKWHWELKKRRSDKMTSSFIDECYEEALRNGARAGKLIGSGGGGFFMFYSKNDDRFRLRKAMIKMGLKPFKIHFDFDGAKILVNA